MITLPFWCFLFLVLYAETEWMRKVYAVSSQPHFKRTLLLCEFLERSGMRKGTASIVYISPRLLNLCVSNNYIILAWAEEGCLWCMGREKGPDSQKAAFIPISPGLQIRWSSDVFSSQPLKWGRKLHCQCILSSVRAPADRKSVV